MHYFAHFIIDASIVFLLTSNLAVAQSKSQKILCPTARGTGLVFPKGNTLQVTAFDRQTNTFQIISSKFPGEGISHVTLEGLSIAVTEVRNQRNAILVQPSTIVDKMYKAEKDLFTLSPQERQARTGCVD